MCASILQPLPTRVLLIRPSALGDVSRTVPALVSLRAAMPEARIDWLVQDIFADAVEHHPALNSVVPFARKELSRFGLSPAATSAGLRFARQLRQNRYDLVIDLQGLFRSGLFTRVTGARRRVGFANARELGWLGYNVRCDVDASMHTVDRMLTLLERIGITAVRDMRLHLGPDDRRWLGTFLDEHGLKGKPYVVIAPTAKWLCKCWPIGEYIELAKHLLGTGEAGEKVIILAAPGSGEQQQIQPLRDALPPDKVLFPTTSVGQMMALLSEARLLVCNDSAPLHIAVGFARPIVTIFGPTDPALVGPYHRDDTVVRPPGIEKQGLLRYRHHKDDQSLIATVSMEAVRAKIAEQLAKAPSAM